LSNRAILSLQELETLAALPSARKFLQAQLLGLSCLPPATRLVAIIDDRAPHLRDIERERQKGGVPRRHGVK